MLLGTSANCNLDSPPIAILSSGEPGGADGKDSTGGGGAEEPVRKLVVLLQSGQFQASLSLAKALIGSNKALFPSPFHLYRALSLSFPSPFPSAASLLVAACAHLKLPDDGLHLVSHIAESRHPFPSLTSCNLLLETLVSLGRYSDAQSLFFQIVASGTSPDIFTHNKLIQSKVKLGDLNGAVALLDEMERKDQLKPDAFTYNVLISGLWKEHRGKDAIKLFDEMLERKIAATQVTYNTMVDGYCKAGCCFCASRPNVGCRIQAEHDHLQCFDFRALSCRPYGGVQKGIGRDGGEWARTGWV